jgi:hypothetical protein
MARPLLVRPLAAHAIGVVRVKVAAMSAGVSDVVSEAGEPPDRVHRLTVSPERWFMRER